MIRTNYSNKIAAVASATVMLALAGKVSAQSSDALIDKLVDKGILTVKEANELRDEADKNFNTALSVKTGMPDWVTAYKFSGDFRGRFEKFTTDSHGGDDRDRLRYRFRAGITVTLKDDLEVGFRLASGDPVSGFGVNTGNSVSANTTFQDNFSRKFIYLDAAYGKWTPLHDAYWTSGVTFGKMDQPFRISNMVFDYDLDPEGLAWQTTFQASSKHSLNLNAAAFVMDEETASSHDPLMYGAQLIWDAKWTPKVESSLGVSAFDIVNQDMLTTANVPYYNQGNTRTAAGVLVNRFNPIVGSGSFTYKLDSFPLYTGAFPIKIEGEYMDNPAVQSNNKGYRAGITFGKAGTKQTWSLAYRYQELQADAWYDQMVDDDNCAFYFNAPSGGKTGYFGGTNVKGHQIIFNYSFTDALTFAFTGYINDLVNAKPTGIAEPKNHDFHGMADFIWKF